MGHSICYNVNVISSALGTKGIPYSSNVSGKSLSTLRCGGNIPLVVKPKDRAQLICALKIVTGEGTPYYPIGACSNTLIPDDGYHGVAIDISNIKTVSQKVNLLEVGAGLRLPALSTICQDINLSGMEPLSGIPGSIGGAITKNAGAFGTDISNLIDRIAFVDLHSFALCEISSSDIPFTYRSSSGYFDDKIIVGATLNLKAGSNIRECTTHYREKRKDLQPSEPSLGSVFKKPISNQSAGYYIENAGLKGTKIGGAMVSSKHANFIVNTGNATSSDYIELANLCANAVKEKFNLMLTKEIDIIGEHHID